METIAWYFGITLDYLAQMTPLAVLAGVCFLCLSPVRRKRLFQKGLVSLPRREAAAFLFVTFAAGLAALTLFPAGFWSSVCRYFLDGRPLEFYWHAGDGFYWEITLLEQVLNGGAWGFFMLLGNLAMFAPFGFFPALLWGKPRWWKSAVIGLSVSSCVECIQLFIGRSSDINDVILNTLGALAGYWIYLLLLRLAPQFTSKFRCIQREVPDGRDSGDRKAPA